MSEKLSHHFVPQFHLRLMAGGRRYLCLASRDSKRFVALASIKDQCARRKYYGSVEFEDYLSKFEGQHAHAFRHARDYAWQGSQATLHPLVDFWLRHAVVLQKARTPRTARVSSEQQDRMFLHAYGEILKYKPQTEESKKCLNAIARGAAKVKGSTQMHLMLSIQLMLQEVHLISDLGLLLLLLRNHTDRPFIVGDSPSVFVNNYMRKVTDFGVLGLGCTGLMISMPLDPRTAILFFDPTVYSVPTAVRDCVDITDVGDVSSLNAVQLHACEENIYFEDQVFQQYVADLIKAHQPLLVTARGNFLVHKPGELLLDGKPTTNDILHTFEPQLPVSLNLGCVETAEWRGHDFGTKGRKAARLRDFNRRPGRHRRISASTLAAELGPQIEF